MNSPESFHLVILLLFALLVNIPLGYLRENSRKYSLLWFLYIHLSIPIIILLRHHYGFGWGLVPFTLACAVGGQIIGGRARRRAARP